MNLQRLCFRELPSDFRLVLRVNLGGLTYPRDAKASSGETQTWAVQDLTLGELAESGVPGWEAK